MNSCENCSKQFIPGRNTTGKYCSRSCAQIVNNRLYPKRKKTRPARVPAKPFIQKYLDGDIDGSVKYGLSAVVRNYLIEKSNYKCESCGFSGVNAISGKTILTVDHTDGDSSNNKIENLKVLCPNCHAMTPTYGALNKGNGRKARYVALGK